MYFDTDSGSQQVVGGERWQRDYQRVARGVM